MVNDRGGGGDPRPCLDRTGGAQTQIRLFAIHEEGRVKSPERLPVGPADQEETSRDDIDLAFTAPVPAAIGFRVEQLALREDPGQPGGAAEDRPEPHLAPARTGIEAAIGKQRPPAPDPRLGAAVGKGDQAVDGMVENHRVGVQQKQILAARPGGGDIVALGEAVVVLFRQQGDLGKFGGNRLGRAIRRDVVDHDHLVRHGGLGRDRAQTVQRHLAGVVADHQNGNFGVVRHACPHHLSCSGADCPALCPMLPAALQARPGQRYVSSAKHASGLRPARAARRAGGPGRPGSGRGRTG